VNPPPFAVVVVTYNSADTVADTLVELVKQLRSGDELVVVDNSSADGTPDAVRAAAPGAHLLEQQRNIGFAAGCNRAAAATSAPLLLFLNPDSRPAPGCLDALRRTAVECRGWGAWQALVTMDGGRKINTAGNVAHYLGMGWAGRCGAPVTEAPRDRMEPDFASGAALVVRREAWQRVDGFEADYFMYGEDLDLALRLWSVGWAVGVEPNARVEHEYEFAKGDRKWFLLERNRWWTVLSDYPAALIVLLLPALAGAEIALIPTAAQDGWLRAKLASQAALLRELPRIVRRRRQVQARRTATTVEFARHLSASLESQHLGGLARRGRLGSMQRAYWSAVRALLEAVASPATGEGGWTRRRRRADPHKRGGVQ
jgi:N-acetylglucosaminyl-diphospho-decaprenol L-rhamnosyltransferase